MSPRIGSVQRKLYSMNELGIGGVLRTALRVWKANVLPFTAVALLVYSPMFVFMSLANGKWHLYLYPVGVLLDSLIAALVTYGVIMELNGTRPSFRACVLTGFAQLPRVLGVVFLSTLAVYGGMMLLIVPGVLLYLNLYVAVPAAIVEKQGVMAALRRSKELVHGNRGRLLLMLFVFGLSTAAINWALRHELPVQTLTFVGVGVQALAGLFSALAAAVVYTSLRHAKDGTSVPELATAFVRTTAV